MLYTRVIQKIGLTQDLGLGNTGILFPSERNGMVRGGRGADQEWTPETEGKTNKSSKRWGQTRTQTSKSEKASIFSVAADLEHSSSKKDGQEGI